MMDEATFRRESDRALGDLKQALMRAELEAIHGLSGISPNLFEVTGKMLG